MLVIFDIGEVHAGSAYHSLISKYSQATKDFFGPNGARTKIPDDRRKQIQRKQNAIQRPEYA